MASRATKSVKFEILGSRTTATSTSASLLRRPKRSERLSSSSKSTSMKGTSPATGTPHFSRSISSPSSKSVGSPRNLFTTVAFTICRSSSSKSIMVPTSWAKTPPRSMSPTSRTGAFASFAIPMLTMSSRLRLSSTGLPAPSMTMTSKSAARRSYDSLICSLSVRLNWKYSRAGMVATGLPHTITWLPVSLVGFRRMGFMSAKGSMPAASACMAWARPISRPSRVMAELRAMF